MLKDWCEQKWFCVHLECSSKSRGWKQLAFDRHRTDEAKAQKNKRTWTLHTQTHTHTMHIAKLCFPITEHDEELGISKRTFITFILSLSLYIYIYVSINHHVEYIYIYVSILTAGTLPTWPTCFKHATHPGGGLTDQTAWQHMATEDRSAQSQHFFFTSGNPQN